MYQESFGKKKFPHDKEDIMEFYSGLSQKLQLYFTEQNLEIITFQDKTLKTFWHKCEPDTLVNKTWSDTTSTVLLGGK